MKKNQYLEYFSIPKNQIYVNNAAIGKIPQRSISDMKSLLDYLAENGEPPLDVLQEKFDAMRRFGGKLLGAAPENLAFVSNTSDGLMIALDSIKWNPGDNVIIQSDAFPASHYILEYSFPELEKRYLAVNDSRHFFDELKQTITPKTRAVVVDQVNFLTGYRLDLKALGEICRQRNVYSIVDGIQAAGACEVAIEASGIDFFAAGGQKWLLSPMGTGLFYLKKELIPELRTVRVGWLSAQWDDFSSFYPLKPLHPDARRFEYANTNLIGVYGLTASLGLLSEIGVAKLSETIFETTRYISAELAAREMEIISDWPRQHRSGIVTFRHPNIETSLLFQKLRANQVICSSRENYIRFSIHFYNSLHQMERILEIIDEILRELN